MVFDEQAARVPKIPRYVLCFGLLQTGFWDRRGISTTHNASGAVSSTPRCPQGKHFTPLLFEANAQSHVCLPPVPPHRRACRMQSAFRRVKRPVTDMSHVNLPQERIRFAHALQDTCGTDPKNHRQADAPPGTQTEPQCESRECRDQYQFPIPTKELIGPVDRRMDQHRPRCGSARHS